jgi:hypothetical protein
MGFTKLEKSVLNVSALPDKVENQAQQLKATFDQAGVDIKEAHNALVTELESNTSAENLGAKNANGETSNVQAELDNKVEKVEGKQLSTEDYTAEEKAKLAELENYTLPEASTTTLGGIKVDGQTIVVDNGVAKAKGVDAADYTARAEIAELKITKAEKKVFTATIPITGWVTGEQSYIDVTVNGILESDYPHITPIYTNVKATDDAIQESWNKIKRASAVANGLRVYAEEVPTTEIPIQIEVVR